MARGLTRGEFNDTRRTGAAPDPVVAFPPPQLPGEPPGLVPPTAGDGLGSVVQRFRASPLLEHLISGVGENVVKFEDQAARAWFFTAIAWLTIVDLIGLTMAIELVVPDLFHGTSWLVFSRIRQAHVNGVIFFWLTSMYWGAFFFIMPRLCGVSRIWSEKLGIATAIGWNVLAVSGVVTLAMGFTQSREYEELIWPLDVLLIVLWMINYINLLMTVMYRRVRSLYVAQWWMLASPLYLAADYFIGNVMWRPGNLLGNGIPGAALSGALPDPMADAMLNWWANHNLFGLWLTPGFQTITYYLVPKITNTPLYSHQLSLISFWGLTLTYTGVGHHHLLQAPIPDWLKTFATVNSIFLLIPVFAFLIDTWMTMRGNWDKFFTIMPLRFTMTGFIFYALVNIQGSLMAVPVFNQMIHFTNFIVAHAHLALLGAFTIVGMGIIDYAIPIIYRRPLYSRRLVEWQYWLILIGFLIFFFSLTFASFLQGEAWISGIPEVNVLPMIKPHLVGRAIGGSMIVVSGFVQLYNIWRTVAGDTSRTAREEIQPYFYAAQPPRVAEVAGREL